jgi:UDP-N-acetylmuramoyl-tripeptide--D-alanyl-D-alanine ligase
MKQKLGLLILYYLRFFAKLQLKKNPNCKIIGITGSAGKSSTRNAIYSVLASKYKVKASFKANSESGISLDILGLEMNSYSLFNWLRVIILAPFQLLTYHQKFAYYLVEMGIDSPFPPKNMEFLLSIIRPEMAVFLNANTTHGFAFDQLLQETNPLRRKEKITYFIAKEKAKLIHALPKTGLAFLNADDKNIKTTCQNLEAETYFFGSNNFCDLQITKHQVQLLDQQIHTTFNFQVQNHYHHLIDQNQNLEIIMKDYFLPKHYAYSFAAAILIGLKAGLQLAEIKTALEKKFTLPLGRASVIEGKHQSLIIDSSYNASSMQDMIELMAQISNPHGKKLALLGDMRELGTNTQIMHEEMARLAAQVFDQVFLVGPAMQKYALPILEKKLGKQVSLFSNAVTAGTTIATLLERNDIILVKGSQNTIFLEEGIKKMIGCPIGFKITLSPKCVVVKLQKKNCY